MEWDCLLMKIDENAEETPMLLGSQDSFLYPYSMASDSIYNDSSAIYVS